MWLGDRFVECVGLGCGLDKDGSWNLRVEPIGKFVIRMHRLRNALCSIQIRMPRCQLQHLRANTMPSNMPQIPIGRNRCTISANNPAISCIGTSPTPVSSEPRTLKSCQRCPRNLHINCLSDKQVIPSSLPTTIDWHGI
jgi:hypothetical protein